MKKILKFILVLVPLFACASIYKTAPNVNEIGEIKAVVVEKIINIHDLAKKYDLGFDELVHANPQIMHKKTIEPGSVIVLPTRFILPESPHKGIVINLPEKRMYLYKKNSIYTFPVGIGRQGWATPEGTLKVIEKKKNPHWFVPKAVLEVQKSNGVNLPKVMDPGPDNPLGKFAIRLSKRNYLIHGTNDTTGVGKRSSAGCIRMYPKDIAQVYKLVYQKMPVYIVNQPFKIRKLNGDWFIESHAPLIEDDDDRNMSDGAASSIDLSLEQAVELVIDEITQSGAPIPNIAWIREVLHNSTGIPTIIAKNDMSENFLYGLKHNRIQNT